MNSCYETLVANQGALTPRIDAISQEKVFKRASVE